MRRTDVPDEQVHRIVMDLSTHTKRPIRSLTEADFRADRFATTLLEKTNRPFAELREKLQLEWIAGSGGADTPISGKSPEAGG